MSGYARGNRLAMSTLERVPRWFRSRCPGADGEPMCAANAAIANEFGVRHARRCLVGVKFLQNTIQRLAPAPSQPLLGEDPELSFG